MSPVCPPHRVLIVEDDDSTRDLMLDFVQDCGFEATVARDAGEGLDALRGHEAGFCAVLTDQMLGPTSDTGSTMLAKAESEGLLSRVELVAICTGSNGVTPPESLPRATVIRKPVDLVQMRTDLSAACGSDEPDRD